MEPDGMNRTTDIRALRCGERTLAFGRIPLVMGILNVTPDSFSDGGRFADVDAAIEHAHAMARDGADIIDVGGESTRPGSDGVAVEEELDRVMPVIDALLSGTSNHDPIPTPVSIDTRKPYVAREALRRGVHMVNDVTGGTDAGMVDALRDAGDTIPIVLMHMKGQPRSMQEGPWYEDVVAEVGAFLRDRATTLESSGIAGTRIIVDPGIGFGKRVSDNLDLLKNIDALRSLGYPVLIGASRKSFIGSILNRDADGRLCGSLAVAAQCYDSGVEMVRVHDVRETVEMLRVIDAIRHPDPYRSAPAG